MSATMKIQSARATPVARAAAPRARNVTARAQAGAAVPDMNKRYIVNGMLVGATALPTAILAVPFIAFFVPPSEGGSGGGLPAKDQQGNIVKGSSWLQNHPKGDVQLVQGLSGDPTYLMVKEDASELREIGLNAICTHLGCVVPWNSAEKKFKCPCHGSQYNRDGKVDEDIVTLTPWTERDYRTDTDPWWA